MSEEELRACKQYIDDNLSKGFITASSTPYTSPVLFVRKQGGGLWFYVDYRKLNALTKKDKYPLPLIDETLAQLTGCTIMSKIDIRHAFCDNPGARISTKEKPTGKVLYYRREY
jgi:hypothetical protein